MNPATLTFVTTALQVLGLLVAELPEAVALVEAVRGKLGAFATEGRDPTAEEWAALNAQIGDALAKLKPG